MQARLNAMRAMKHHTSGTTYSVLPLFYAQAVRALVDYSTLVLITLSPSQQERLEVLQNTAMRTMLVQAPRWSSACIMQSKTGLVPLTTRVEQIVACRVARVLQRDAEGMSQRRLEKAMTQGAEVLSHNPWLLRSALAARYLPKRIPGPCRSLTSLPTPTAPRPHGSPHQQNTPPLFSPSERPTVLPRSYGNMPSWPWSGSSIQSVLCTTPMAR